ncbi:hypothetical protein SUGI_0316840 [Cryptomeria japonica]|nr:hypothetical protein SUGI_0316840 [Cryptomeria japonica]
MQDIHKREYKFCWHDAILLKARSFLWLALNNKILIGDRLSRLGISTRFLYVLCGKDREDTSHLFLSCEFSQECWTWVLVKLRWEGPLLNSLSLMLVGGPLLHRDSFLAEIWKIAPSFVAWGIWWERNKRIFRKDCSKVGDVCVQIEKCILENVNAFIMRTKTLSSLFSSSDNIILNKWRKICIPFKGVLIGKIPKLKHHREVKWERLSKSYINFNFDGASRRNPGRSGVGCVIRDHGGHIKKALLARLPDGSNSMAEASTLLEGVRLAISLGISKLHIEGDA